ncbi:YgaP family membrane protein [Candidatus Nanohalovita haloferacivicina]|uniref:YgaP family membrane protein n=1 Tax=Candidatus Nanohalovita haloferacivicina TaxID=2978046 RepID=UPI00325FD7CA|nr:DUF2892 family protein [Candidatus Nanohalobia archaeon BNXNv]
MEKNVGDTDALVRIVAGAVAGLTSLGILVDMVPGPEIASPVLGVIAVVLLATGYFGTCGLYSVLGIDTSE